MTEEIVVSRQHEIGIGKISGVKNRFAPHRPHFLPEIFYLIFFGGLLFQGTYFMLRFHFAVVLLAISFMSTAGTVRAENWPGWRGPRGDGTSLERGIPVRWSSTENIAWKSPVPYIGHASPVVWEDRIYLVGTDLEKQDRALTAFDRKTGKQLWSRTVVHSPLEGKHRLNS
jgi:hypothetical protein